MNVVSIVYDFGHHIKLIDDIVNGQTDTSMRVFGAQL